MIPSTNSTPHIWATLALLGLVVTGFVMLWVSALPDLANVRDNASGWRQRWAARLAPNWKGTSEQWNFLYHRLGIIGALYFMMLVSTHSKGMNSSRLNRPTIDHISAARDMGRRQWALASLGAMATIGAAWAVVNMNAKMAA